MLNKSNKIFKGDLDIALQSGSTTSFTDIPFGGVIDINSPLVTSFAFTVKEFYRDNALELNCDEKFQWREIRVFRERELTLYNSYTIDKGHPSNTIVGDISELTGPTLVTHAF